MRKILLLGLLLAATASASVEVNSGGGSSASIGGAVTGGTAGSVYFGGAAGVLAQDNTKLFYDDTNNRLGIGIATPLTTLHVAGTTAGTIPQMVLTADDDPNLRIQFRVNGSAVGFIQPIYNGVDYTNLVLNADGGNVGVGTEFPTAKLDVNSDTVRVRTAKTPASASDTCDQGEIAWDTSFIYVCTATDTWKRTAIATW